MFANKGTTNDDCDATTGRQILQGFETSLSTATGVESMV